VTDKVSAVGSGLNSDVRLEMLQRSILVAITIGAIFSVFNLTHGLSLLGWVEAVLIAITGLLYVWTFTRPAWVNRIANLIVLFAATIAFMAMVTGGLAGIGFVWSVGFPFIACFLVGARTGAYTLFGFLAYFMTSVREHGEALLLEAKRQLKMDSEALAESEARSRTLLNTMPGGVGVHRNGQWVYMNPAGIRMLHASGIEDVIGTSVFDYVHPDHHIMAMERMENVLATGQPAPVVEMKLLRTDGEVFPAEAQGARIEMDGCVSVMTVFRDISEHKQAQLEREHLQQQMEHAQRLESLGVLAGGIAHDFNNMLAGIMGSAELSRMEAGESCPISEYLKTIETTCEQAAELCKQMLAYAGKGRYVADVLNINRMVRDMGRLIQSSAGNHIEVKIELDDALPAVMADRAQMQQVVLNFIINAAEAIGSQPGEIQIKTKSVHADREMLDSFYNGRHLAEGRYVSIQVSDTGCGMDEATQARIFDPFFTSKEAGSGLGLSAVLGIVRGHKGGIQVESRPGEGSLFGMLLPVSEQKVRPEAVTTGEIEDWQGSGAILIVDDDADIRKVAGRLVRHFNFDVLYATDGLEGVEAFRRHQDNIAVVLLDMTMPGMGGVDAMRGIRKIDPDVPILIASGYSDVAIEMLPESEQPDAFVQKPFRAKTLKKALFQVLRNQS